MAKMNPGVILSRTAGVDLRSRQYHAVKPGTVTNEVLLAVDATNAVMGLLENKPAQGSAAGVVVSGTGLWMISDSSLAPGARLRPNTVGRGVLAAANQPAMATLQEQVTGSGQIAEVQLTIGGSVIA